MDVWQPKWCSYVHTWRRDVGKSRKKANHEYTVHKWQSFEYRTSYFWLKLQSTGKLLYWTLFQTNVRASESLIRKAFWFEHAMLISVIGSVCVFSHSCYLCLFKGGHHQDTKVQVDIKVKDVNDNPPEFANNNEVFMCESILPGSVCSSMYPNVA